MSANDPSGAIEAVPFRERFTTCASCRAEARWMVAGTTTCDRHRSTWIRRASERAEVTTPKGGAR